ncbi:NFACT family protein [Aliibacillus thermotolerans]|uniref:Rqc2 homolog RqcH n=1 Tax=Aliibacillus thermotolerans TaxID=1834418 RepID=A0ABW0U5I7_9BACI|nr:NFACT RNA binding domain-containing protein [Aliibacillus thermotolerans]MDA3130672.1 DUF814 domain-containing protein [Aliibacillus thermotolerans]
MAFDGMMMRAVLHECEHTIKNGRITKVRQPHDTDLLLTIRANRHNYQLLLSANAHFARFHLTEEKMTNPEEPPMFCMMLRKHIENGRLIDMKQDGLERIVTFVIEGKDEIGDVRKKHLIVELMGKHSNILLVDPETNLILDSMKHIPPSVNRHRTILPGRTYIEPPKQQKLNPLTADEEAVLKKLDMNSGRLDKQLVDAFEGISPQSAKEIVHRAGLGHGRKLAKTFVAVMQQIKQHRYDPQIVENDKKEFYSVIALTHVDGKVKTFEHVGEMLDRFFVGKAERDRVKQQANDMERLLRNEWQKNKRKLKKLEKTLSAAKQMDQYQKLGELLTAHLHLLQGGETSIEVVDYYDEEGKTITIPLDREKSPSENAQHYFRKYNKAKTSLVMTKKQMEETKEEIRYLEQLIQQLESASLQDIEEIREELREEGYLKKRSTTKKKRKQSRPSYETFLSSEGIPILVGKNNKQNEYITNRVAHKEDTWLHTKDIPGSHVVIRSSSFGEQTLLEAAQLAAYYSKAKDSSSVPVDYTKMKHVRKPNGAKPGFVIYDHQSTLFVTPDKDIIFRLERERN